MVYLYTVANVADVVVVVVYSGYVVSNVRCAVDAAIVVVICAVCVFLVGWLA